MDINKIKDHCLSIGLNEYQIETVLSYLDSMDDAVESTDILEMGEKDIIRNIVIPFNLKRMTDGIINRINDKKKHTVMGVFGSPTLGYTLGLSTLSADPHELYILTKSLPISTVQGILNNLIGLYPDGSYVDYPTMLDDYLIDGSPMRCVVKLEDNADYIKERLFARIENLAGAKVPKIYRVYIADKNNLLPGEDGYDGFNIDADAYNQ